MILLSYLIHVARDDISLDFVTVGVVRLHYTDERTANGSLLETEERGQRRARVVEEADCPQIYS